MQDCRNIRADFARLLEDRLPSDARGRLETHVANCSACAEELDLVRTTWDTLPDARDVAPPLAARTRVLSYAKQHEGIREGAPAAVRWRQIGPPAAVGFVAALAILHLVRLRGAIAPFNASVAALLSLSFAALLAVVSGGLFRSHLPRVVRTTLVGAVGALGGYFLLTLALPVTDTVDICGEFVFGNIHMSLGQLCSVYLVVTGLYAAIPMAIVAYTADGTVPRGRGVTEALVFALLTAPLLLLQAGFDVWLVPLSVVAGFAGGAVLGQLAGHRARLWMLEQS